MTQMGQLFEFFPTAGNDRDTSRLELPDRDLPPRTQVVDSKACDRYLSEDHLANVNGHLNPIRKKDLRHPPASRMPYRQAVYRKGSETTTIRILRIAGVSCETLCRGASLTV